jgi:hypothetical protein
MEDQQMPEFLLTALRSGHTVTRIAKDNGVTVLAVRQELSKYTDVPSVIKKAKEERLEFAEFQLAEHADELVETGRRMLAQSLSTKTGLPVVTKYTALCNAMAAMCKAVSALRVKSAAPEQETMASAVDVIFHRTAQA